MIYLLIFILFIATILLLFALFYEYKDSENIISQLCSKKYLNFNKINGGINKIIVQCLNDKIIGWPERKTHLLLRKYSSCRLDRIESYDFKKMNIIILNTRQEEPKYYLKKEENKSVCQNDGRDHGIAEFWYCPTGLAKIIPFRDDIIIYYNSKEEVCYVEEP